MDACALVRATTLRVASSPSCAVSIADAPLRAFARRLAAPGAAPCPAWDEGGLHFVDATDNTLTAQYVLVLDALNFCFWPSSAGPEYDALALGLTTALKADSLSFSAARLAVIDEATLRTWLPLFPALDERAARLREVGEVLGALYGGSALAIVAEARNSAVELVRLITAAFPGFRDECVAPRDGKLVHFYKRAQICVGDLWAAGGRKSAVSRAEAAAFGPFCFFDIAALTCFADYRLPQLLRAEGVLVYSAALACLVDARQPLAAGGADEIDIRAATVVAVERLRDELGGGRPAVELDWLLWNEGERRKEALLPHHKCCTIFYFQSSFADDRGDPPTALSLKGPPCRPVGRALTP